MKTGNFHVLTQIFPKAFAIFAKAAAFAGPDNIGRLILILALDSDHHLMAQNPGEYKIPVALFPHFGISSANGTAENIGQDLVL
jgi:hypothetical protein